MSASTVGYNGKSSGSQQCIVSTKLSLETKCQEEGRAVVVAENELTGGIVVNGGDTGFGSNTNEKDLCHTKRGEAVIERPQEISHPKKGLIVASAISTGRKNSTLKPEKPRWQTVFSIVTKNSLLLTVIFGLGWITWRCADQLVNSVNLPSSGVYFDGWILDVEASLKATEKMMQGQLESLDRKLGSEISSARREMTEQIEGKRAFFEKELKKLETKTDNSGKSLADVRDTCFSIQEDIGNLLNDLKSNQNPEEDDKTWGLDDIRSYARDVIARETEKHAADGLGRVDYALASGGARVVRHSAPYGPGKGSWLPVGKGQNRVHENAHKMLQPSFGEPGQCFPLRGNTGFVEIKLRTAIILDSVTLEHVAKNVAYDRSSAPKDCRISAWLDGPGDDPSTRTQRMFILMEFTYDLEKSNAQTFNIETADAGVVNMVRLDFSSNHGSSSHTCIYRLRVHGFDPKTFVEMAVHA